MDVQPIPARHVGVRPFVAQIVAPSVAAVTVMAGLIAALIMMAGRQADTLASQRQQQIVAAVLDQNIQRTAHDQEVSTVWDEAVRQVRSPDPDLAWLDQNLGTWLNTYYGHDQAVIIDGQGKPIYAMRDRRRLPANSYYNDLAKTAAPLAAVLRHKLRHPSPSDVSDSVLTPGAIDLSVVSGHPAIVSVKPIVSETGNLRQVPGTEYLHISVRYLDGKFMRELARQYQLDGARFLRDPDRHETNSMVPLTSSAGRLLGYIAWEPFRPGSLMIKRLAPVMGIALLLMFSVVSLLLRHVRRSTLQLEASEAQAQHLAFHDPLTGLANRALFEDKLAHELARARASAGSLALLYLDLDGFKHVNDTLGHPAGDELIRAVGQRLSATVRATDLVARIGGDEFAIIQTEIHGAAEAEILCMRIIEEINMPFEVAGTQARVGVSIGIAMGPADAGDRTELSRKADIALYEAKASGKGRFTFFAEGMDASIRRRKEIENGLRTALTAGDQLEVYYQPLYSAINGSITGAEALVRWHHPQHGTISPVIFVPIAEQTGLINQLGLWVLEQACATAARWPINTISVNVSAVQLRDNDFSGQVFGVLDRTGLAPSRLEIEITETSFIENPEHCQPNLSALRARGIKIALDDFGTGYSSFSHLRNFQVDRIKIDRSFVSGIGAGEEGSSIIQAIVDLAKAGGLKVTAEGVETSQQRAFLSDVGCNSLQGYLLARPMPASAMDTILGLAAQHELSDAPA
jgi:diguanylate cyclase (GGDEF)-like protein